jgi:hypothetical protein
MNRTLVFAAVAALLMLPAPIARATPELPAAQQSDEEEALAGLQAAIAEMRAAMLRPGDRVEGWDVGGADLDAEIRARGADRHYSVTSGDRGTSVGILTDRPIRDFVPAGWRVVDSFGSETADLDDVEVGFEALSPRFVVGVRGEIRRVNDVACFGSIDHALLFEVPGAPSRADDDMMPVFFRMGVLAMEGQTICVRADGDDQNGYRLRYFLPDGRLLPELTDANEITRIVPAAPIDTLLEPPPEPARGPGPTT